MIRWLKYQIARIIYREMVKEFQRRDGRMDEVYRQKWIFIQGQLLTRGRMKWNWRKLASKKAQEKSQAKKK